MPKPEKAAKKAEKNAEKEEKAEKGERKRDQFGDFLQVSSTLVLLTSSNINPE